MEIRKSYNVKIEMKLSSKATMIAFIYNILLISLDFILTPMTNTSLIFSKPSPGFHVNISIPSIPPVLSDIDIELSSAFLGSDIFMYIISLVLTSFFQLLFLATFINESFREEIHLDASPFELTKRKLPVFLAYNFLIHLLILALMLITAFNPILGAISILATLILIFTLIYVPVILLMEPLGVIESMRKSFSMVTNNLDEFFKILIVSSIVITVFTTIISFMPVELAIVIALLLWLPAGSLIVSMIISAYNILRET